MAVGLSKWMLVGWGLFLAGLALYWLAVPLLWRTSYFPLGLGPMALTFVSLLVLANQMRTGAKRHLGWFLFGYAMVGLGVAGAILGDPYVREWHFNSSLDRYRIVAKQFTDNPPAKKVDFTPEQKLLAGVYRGSAVQMNQSTMVTFDEPSGPSLESTVYCTKPAQFDEFGRPLTLMRTDSTGYWYFVIRR